MFNQSGSVKFCHMRMLYIPSEDAGYVRKGDEKGKEISTSILKQINSAFHLSIQIFIQIHLYFKIY